MPPIKLGRFCIDRIDWDLKIRLTWFDRFLWWRKMARVISGYGVGTFFSTERMELPPSNRFVILCTYSYSGLVFTGRYISLARNIFIASHGLVVVSRSQTALAEKGLEHFLFPFCFSSPPIMWVVSRSQTNFLLYSRTRVVSRDQTAFPRFLCGGGKGLEQFTGSLRSQTTFSFYIGAKKEFLCCLSTQLK